MSDTLNDALQRALEALAEGKSIEQALAAQEGERQAELRPLLEAAIAAARHAAPDLSQDALRRSRRRAQARAAGLQQAALHPPLLRLLPRIALVGAALVVALAVGVDGISSAAAQSLPGEILYPVKIVSESLQLRLASRPVERLNLEAIYSQRRVEEVIRLLALGRKLPLSFQAVVEEIGPTLWTVGGVQVRVSPDTRILGEILAGMTVDVEGETQTDGTFLAHELHLQSFDTLGPVTSIGPETWSIGEASIAVDGATWIEPGIEVGDLVLVRIRVHDDGSRVAESILFFAPPTPTPHPAPPRTAEPVPPSPLLTETAEASNSEEENEGDDSDPGDDGTSEPDGDGDEIESGDGEGDGEGEGQGEEEGQEEIKEEFEGVVESIGGSQWIIDGRTLQVNGDTEIRGDPKVGDTVKVVAFRHSDGSWWAEKIELED